MSFDAIAPFYRLLETVVFGNALQRARTAFLGQIDDCRRALLIGEGNGRFLAELLAQNGEMRATCIEQSVAMIRLSRGRLTPQQLARVEFIQADIRDAEAAAPFDLIVTNFVLDCFDEAELPRVVGRIASCAAPGAKWLLAEFSTPDRGDARLAARILIAAMYTFFRATTRITASHLLEYGRVLERSGFRRECYRTSLAGMVSAGLWRR